MEYMYISTYTGLDFYETDILYDEMYVENN